MTTPATREPASEQLLSVLRFVRTHSPFYRDFYAQVPQDAARLDDYPVLDSQAFWAANTVQGNTVLTAPITEGITFKSGGTTGHPKYSVFTYEEWRAFTKAFGQGMRRAGLQPGQRIGNLFYAGKLYASFLFITRSIEAAGISICYPLAGDDLDEIIAAWRQFDIDVLAGVPTTLMKLLERLTPEDKARLKLTTFLFGGEPMFADQIAAVQAVFPGCQVRSIGVAGVDYGELGWASPGAEPGVHHCFDDSTVMELIDDATGEPIDVPGRTGRIVLTNLARRLMPIIRYPVGDRGEWLDPVGTPSRRFRLLGRTEEGARVGPMSLYVDDMRQALTDLEHSEMPLGFRDFQMVIEHHERLDACCLRIAVERPQERTIEDTRRVIDRVYAARPMYRDLQDQQLVHGLTVQWVTASDLHTNARTGKLLRVVDHRHG
ncbi:phenylacetate--CoA ligase family protein [Ottowia thiooxydans]|uniref:phenylacetate--CoA ligase family protein n=1 Tax=Ottowia thiooxydans TaxID=219182 RepID=UPI000559EC71|nr:AMP-binding protein [Ottowia thiooxydans]